MTVFPFFTTDSRITLNMSGKQTGCVWQGLIGGFCAPGIRRDVHVFAHVSLTEWDSVYGHIWL